MRIHRNQRGATAILVASSLTLLVGMAAIAVDLSAGWNERRKDQTAADLAATAGAIAYVANNVQTETVNQVLGIAAVNLGLSTDPTWGYTTTDAAWRNAWTGCTDPQKPANFNAFNRPASWGGGTIPCISGSHNELRVKLPTQFVATTFGRVLGQNQLATSAAAHARLRFRTGGGVRPFGILNGISAGSTCLTTSPGGLAAPPCDGPASGNFGTLNSQTWGSTDHNTTIDCGTPGNEELGQAIAKGLDHLIGLMPPYAGTGVAYGTVAYPSSTARDDDCTVSGGQAVPADNNPNVGPVNSMRADTGFNLFQATKNGLLSGEDGFPNSTVAVTPLLQDLSSGSLSNRLLSERIGATQRDYRVDNTPLWMHMKTWGQIQSDISSAGLGAGAEIAIGSCKQAVISGSANPSNAMSTCLRDYEIALGAFPNLPPIFLDSLGNNPRFGFVPQFHATTWGSGNHWQPILRYRMMYIDTIWFNCNGKYDSNKNDEACTGTKGLVFAPGGPVFPNDTSDLKVGTGGSMKQLRLDQISAFLIPNPSVSEDTASRFPGNVFGPFQVQLVR